jgi:hypothetical protein
VCVCVCQIANTVWSFATLNLVVHEDLLLRLALRAEMIVADFNGSCVCVFVVSVRVWVVCVRECVCARVNVCVCV